MSCLPCGKVSDNERIALKYYQDLFKNKGIIHYAYRLDKNDSFKFVINSSFNDIFKKQIKPNFGRGSEYYHIQEFKGN